MAQVARFRQPLKVVSSIYAIDEVQGNAGAPVHHPGRRLAEWKLVSPESTQLFTNGSEQRIVRVQLVAQVQQ